MSSLRKQSLINVLWSGFGQFSIQGLTFLTAAVLARFLSPEAFGLVGMVLVLNAFLVIFANAGLRTTIVQHQDFSKKEHQALLGLALLIGCLVGALFVSAAPFAVIFFEEDRLLLMCFALAPAVLMTALTQVPMGVLEKKMGFRKRALAQFFSVLAASIIAIGLAVNDFGYWALILQILLRNSFLLLTLSVMAGIGWIPKFNLPLYKQIFGYTGNLTAFQIVNYFHRNLDNILIGKFLGVASLGLYTRAYSLMSVFRQTLSSVIAPVMHSAMAKRQNDIHALRRAYAEIITAILWLSAPIMGLLAAFSDEVIVLVWGKQFSDAGPAFFWLALAGMHQGVFGTLGAVFAVRNKTKELFFCGLTTTILFGVGIYAGLGWGITGVSIGYSVMSHLIFLPLMAYIWKVLLGGRIYQLLTVLWAPLLVGSVAVFTVMIGSKWIIDESITVGLAVTVIGLWGLSYVLLGYRECCGIIRSLGLLRAS